jgi:hypothetical protein
MEEAPVSPRTTTFTLLSLGLMLLLAGSGLAPRVVAEDTANSVTTVEFIVDPPTLINLGFEWMIQGDDNRNAKVEVTYRKKGEAQWKTACRS